ncbi:MAG: PA14 domain-containing protein [Cellvibrionaceae bacterium]
MEHATKNNKFKTFFYGFAFYLLSHNTYAQFNYSVYDGVFDALPDFSTLAPIASGQSSVIDVSVTTEVETFALVFTRQIIVSTAGEYTFSTTSDDGSKLYIDGAVVVDNDGLHGPVTVTNAVFLNQGTYDFRVEFFERGGGEVLEVSYRTNNSVAQPIPADGVLEYIESQSPYEIGDWGDVILWPEIAISAANLPDGRVLTWSSTETNSFPGNREFTHASVFDPITETFQNAESNFHDMFCAGISLLEDGTIVASGGNPSDRRTSSFDVTSLTWAPLANMIDARWYGANITLPNNQIFSSFGKDAGNRSEIYDPALNTWFPRSNVSMQTLLEEQNAINASPNPSGALTQEWWAHIAVTPQGDVFQGGPTPTWHRFDPINNTPNEVLGQPIGDTSRMYGNAVTYDVGKVMLVGGADRRLANPTSVNNVYLVDLNGPAPVVTSGAPMNYPRALSNTVTLPNGEVLVIGGNTVAKIFNDQGSVFPAEIYNPEMDSWRIVDSIDIPRNYHSTALLLKDGRVLSAGGGACGNGCAANHLDGQIFSPPYLFSNDGTLADRPVVNSAPEQAKAGEQITVTASSDTVSFSMVRLSGTTHHLNTDQRFLPVNSVDNGDGTFTLTLQANPNVLIVGNYWLYALNDQGTPSVGETINIVREDESSSAPGYRYYRFTPTTLRDVNADSVQLAELTFYNDNTRLDSATILNPLGNNPANEQAEKVNDNNVNTKWLDFNKGALIYDFGDNIVADSYRFTTANDVEGRDPIRWLLEASKNSEEWTIIDDRRDVDYPTPFNRFTAIDLISISTQLNDDVFLSDLPWISEVNGWGPAERDRSNGEQGVADGITLQLNGITYDKGIGAHSYSQIDIDLNGQYTRFLSDIGLDDERADGVCGDIRFEVDVDGNNIYTSNGFTTTTPTESIDIDVENALLLTLKIVDNGGGACGDHGDWADARLSSKTIAPVDTDGDGVPDSTDAFPNDPTESIDTDSDGVGDNADAFPNDASETVDSDGDGVGDNADAYPNDPTRTTDAEITPLPELPRHSSTLITETLVGDERLWNVNPDNNSVSVSDSQGNLIAEITVGNTPWSLALSTSTAQIYVTNKKSATLSIIDANTLTVIETIALKSNSQPHGIVFNKTGSEYYIVLEALGEIEKRSTLTNQLLDTIQLSGTPRHLSIAFDDSTLFVSDFITPLISGESTANQINISEAKARIIAIALNTFQVSNVIGLSHDSRGLSESQGPGMPNYLGAPVVSFDDQYAYIPSKKDNVSSGMLRQTFPLTFDSAVRAQTSRISLTTQSEDLSFSVDHDNSSVATSAALSGDNRYLFVTLETSRELVVYDTVLGFQLVRLPTGRAPQSVVLSSDGSRAYVHNFMDRSISRFNLTPILLNGTPTLSELATINVVTTETLTPDVLLGKQHFYDAADDRLARDNYMSCASCHKEGKHDGRVWDFSQFGEGLRSTVSLIGKGGLAQGALHWTGNFDEVQDFEGQIRTFAGGTGLMNDSDFNSGTRNQALGDKKAGVSVDLDALAAYLNSLDETEISPLVLENNLSLEAEIGQQVFIDKGCHTCHAGERYTDSALDVRHDIGTLTTASGQRLSQALDGFDTPSLLGLWKNEPYLHDGSAITLNEAIRAHTNITTTDAEADALTAYLYELKGPQDSDNDGFNDNVDLFPNDPTRNTGIWREWWSGISGSTLPNLKQSPNYPNNPTGIEQVNNFSGPTNWLDNYGTRIRGIFYAPVTGDYTFWASGDDNVELYLSPNSNADNKVLIAQVPGWSNPQEWTKYPEQKSVDIRLVRGQAYYLEALHKEGGGGDNIAIGWQLSGVGAVQLLSEQYFNGPIVGPIDSDGDGVTDDNDAFPFDASETKDTDNDGLGDNADPFPNDPSNNPSNVDSDNDGVNDIIDLYPADPSRSTGIWREWWSNISGNSIVNLTQSLNYPGNPSGDEQIDRFAGPTNWSGNYGTRIRGIFYAPVSGNYTFWASGDDNVELYLSSNSNPINKTVVARVPGWTSSEQWNKYPEQKSSPVSLVAGQAYYLEVLHKEGGGGDNLAIGWQLPNSTTIDVIGSEYFETPVTRPVDSDGDGVNDNVDLFPNDPTRNTGIWREWWSGISGSTLSNLKQSANYPNNPTGIEQVDDFKGPTNWSDNYGTRIRGIFYAPASGDYTFWASGDDNVELYLSPDSNADNKVLIAQVPGWSNPQEWTKFPEQKSLSIALAAGEPYYFEVLHKEGAGGDNVAIGWQFSGVGAIQLLSSRYFNGPISGSIDSDGDGSTDDSDAFPFDASEVADSDGDGIGDNADPFPQDANNNPINIDSDGDGFTDLVDLYPHDASRNTGIWREWWSGIAGNSITNLTQSANYPGNPSGDEQMNRFAGPTNWSGNYGTRIRGIFYAPISGNYTFWASGDDNVELYLSTDSNPINKTMIANVPGWTASQQWNKYPQQQSSAVTLNAGQAYYIEVLHKEGGGGDNVAIGWQLPNNNSIEVIASQYFNQ